MVSVFFSDIVGFTTLCSMLAADKVYPILDAPYSVWREFTFFYLDYSASLLTVQTGHKYAPQAILQI